MCTLARDGRRDLEGEPQLERITGRRQRSFSMRYYTR